MAEIGNNTVFTAVDANNNSGTVPTFAEGMAPSQVNDSARALQGAVKREWQWRNLLETTGGAANAYTATYSVAPAAYYNGQIFSVIASFANTGSATFNVNTLGAKTIKKVIAGALTNLASGDVPAGEVLMLAYNTANDVFVWVNRGALDTVAALATANTFTANQVIQSVNAGAGADPDLVLDRFSASPAAADELGQVVFRGRNASAAITDYAKVQSAIIDTTAGSEDGKLNFQTRTAGALSTALTLADGLYTPGATGGDKGLNTINVTTYYLGGVRIFSGIARKGSDTTRNSDTALTADSALTFPIAANTDYEFEFSVFYSTVAAADFKFDIDSSAATDPSVTHMAVSYLAPNGTAYVADIHNAVNTVVSPLNIGGAIRGHIIIKGMIQNGANAGDLRFRWAQNTSDAGDTTVLRGSKVNWTVL